MGRDKPTAQPVWWGGQQARPRGGVPRALQRGRDCAGLEPAENENRSLCTIRVVCTGQACPLTSMAQGLAQPIEHGRRYTPRTAPVVVATASTPGRQRPGPEAPPAHNVRAHRTRAHTRLATRTTVPSRVRAMGCWVTHTEISLYGAVQAWGWPQRVSSLTRLQTSIIIMLNGF